MKEQGRSTTPSPGDLIPGDPRTSTAPCVCGGLLICLPGEDVQLVVQQHNRSGLHLFWRWRTGRVALHRWLGVP